MHSSSYNIEVQNWNSLIYSEIINIFRFSTGNSTHARYRAKQNFIGLRGVAPFPNAAVILISTLDRVLHYYPSQFAHRYFFVKMEVSSSNNSLSISPISSSEIKFIIFQKVSIFRSFSEFFKIFSFIFFPSLNFPFFSKLKFLKILCGLVFQIFVIFGNFLFFAQILCFLPFLYFWNIFPLSFEMRLLVNLSHFETRHQI